MEISLAERTLPRIARYQIDCLLSEILVMEDRITALEDPVETLQSEPPRARAPKGRELGFLTLRALEVFWTVTRVLGLAHWHDGSRTPIHVLMRHKGLELYWTVSRWMGLRHLHDGTGSSGRRVLRPLRVDRDLPRPRNPRVLIDCTDTLSSGLKTGMQRLTRNLCRFAVESGEGIPFFIQDGRMTMLYSKGENDPDLEICADDILLIPEPTKLQVLKTAISRAEEAGAKVVVIVHDLIPLMYPGSCNPAHIKTAVEWFRGVLPHADRVLAVSKSVAGDVRSHFQRDDLRSKPSVKVGWFHHGADLDEITEASEPKTQILADGVPFFLSVGTVEPRKALPIALDSFERHWISGSNVAYIIAGKEGWNVRSLSKRIVEHREYGKRLFWLRDATDQDLEFLYRRAQALVFPSFVEGFGLPLIEAARYGTPVIVSDIPVFREIAGEGANYFDVLDPDSLARQIQNRLDGNYRRPNFEVLSWAQATEIILGMAREHSMFADRWSEPKACRTRTSYRSATASELVH